MLLEQERDEEAAISAALKLLRYDPLHEETYRHLMRLYAVQGDRTSALRMFHTCATILERELGTVPSEATREMYQRLMNDAHHLQCLDIDIWDSSLIRWSRTGVGKTSPGVAHNDAGGSVV